MTTAEMMFSPVGELATERRQEARKIFLALLLALLIHVVVGLVLAVLGTVQPTPAPVEDAPVELTIIDTTPVVPVKPKNNMFMETDESKKTEAPKDKTFESNANSIAASEAPATGDAPIPSQEGKERPGLQLKNQQYSLAEQAAQAQPTVAPQETPKPSEAPTVAPDQLALLTARPTAPPQPKTTPAPQRPNSAYQPQSQQTRIAGAITNRGASAINALGTPLGRYQKYLYDAIGSRWYFYTGQRSDLISIGTAKVSFSVDRSGHVQNLKLVRNSSNEAFANVCLQSILEIKLPPIPEDVADTLPPQGLDQEISFTMYPN
jgi:outer membrane biosynthesis protein TonB